MGWTPVDLSRSRPAGSSRRRGITFRHPDRSSAIGQDNVAALALSLGDLDMLERFLRLTAGRTAQLLNLAELGRDTGVDQSTARRWLSVLKAGFVAFSLRPSHRSLSKRIVKPPKVHFHDVGLCRYLMGLREPDQLPMNQSFGALFETMVITDVRRQLDNAGLQAELSFFRSSDGIEVDLLASICLVQEERPLGNGIRALPWWEHGRIWG